MNEERIYIGSEDYNVYCLNTITGKQIWNYTTGAAITE
jgi:outer membrane protein assembly factor BamB